MITIIIMVGLIIVEGPKETPKEGCPSRVRHYHQFLVYVRLSVRPSHGRSLDPPSCGPKGSSVSSSPGT